MSIEVLVDKRTVGEIQAAIPCEWASAIFTVQSENGKERPCDEVASWIVSWKTHCSHGNPLHPPHTTFFCNKHKKILQAIFRRQDLLCYACGCPLTGLSHLVNDIRKI